MENCQCPAGKILRGNKCENSNNQCIGGRMVLQNVNVIMGNN